MILFFRRSIIGKRIIHKHRSFVDDKENAQDKISSDAEIEAVPAVRGISDNIKKLRAQLKIMDAQMSILKVSARTRRRIEEPNGLLRLINVFVFTKHRWKLYELWNLFEYGPGRNSASSDCMALSYAEQSCLFKLNSYINKSSNPANLVHHYNPAHNNSINNTSNTYTITSNF